ncbi:1-phosphatidylinositol 4,5-bisphosphate phosphodiesterase delta-1-like isoform X1 [Labeo rohita]|uniref:phosphoinositide phospholipase C n=1 Tax=Labeo rohita TaxID=84645 RepID=A0A498LN79_LABRO|nr:1-phosphatidylinositol 4,5-bisphosphate phosphodiesterase delta-1-like isoform X1 [Labeo rohita]RXN14829.1 1-phosphatidylinositol 4,5-bisphosphate phosphodiesterase delta-1-like isoform X1 [Labeo rohita]
MSCIRKLRKRTKSQEFVYQEQCKIVAHENGKRIGLEGDPDLQFLLNGGDLIKVKSRSWRKTRYFRLNEDLKTMWQETSKTFKSNSGFSLEDVDSVRYGRQTDGLRKYTDSSVEDRCLSFIFKGRRKNLDLIASSKEEAKKWVSGLEKVMTGMHSLNRQQNSEQYP